MKKLLLFSICMVLIYSNNMFSQTETNVEELNNLAQKFKEKWEADRAEVINFSQLHNTPVRIENDSVTMEMQYLNKSGMPEYYMTENKNAAATISTNKVHSGGGAGLSLNGSGMTLHEWDGGGVLTTHQEFGSRVTIADGTSGTHYHSTHVAGTLIAAGVDPYAKGMAPSASLRDFDWNSDNSEMASEAASYEPMISNHSYGLTRGWYYDGSDWYWYGDVSVSTTEDYLFGFYDSNAQAWDEIAYNAPFYLICKSAGNDRGDYHSGSHYYWNGSYWQLSTASRDADGGSTGYDCVGSQGTAKNILTVGAVEDIPDGYTNPSDVVMSSFSGWGPADDGRIKPDVVANGVGLYSTFDDSNTSYYSLSGTSMATPSAAGSLILLQEHYEDIKGSGNKMRAATLKALVIHTADEAGPNTGPDYMFGWGLVNIERAAEKITEDDSNDAVISEHTVTNSTDYTTTITATSGYPIKVTICWTDPKGTPTSAQLDPSTPMLVNDLDLRVEDQAARTIFYPWSLDKDNPSNAATNSGENNVDNVEMVYIESPTPGETYTITVDHDGSLSGGSQAFSMIISGYPLAPKANFYADNFSVGLNETVSFTDASTENPTSWSWSISPSTYTFVNSTSSTSQNPEVEFTAAGTYDITLYVENANGNDTELKSSYITASDAPTGYCAAYSTNPAGVVENFSFAGVENYHTGYTDAGSGHYYQDFTTIMINVNLLETYSLYVLNGYDGTGEDLLDLAVWIDFNRDGDFDDTGEQVVCDPDDYGEGTFNVTIPADADLGATRLRVRTKYQLSTCGDPCGSTANGEVEDYLVNIQIGTLTWDGSVSDDWDDPDNWDGGVVPTSSFDVIIPDAATVPNTPMIYNGTTATCANLTLESNAILENNGTLNLTGN